MKRIEVVCKVLFTIIVSCQTTIAISVALTLKSTGVVTGIQKLIAEDRMKELSEVGGSSSSTGIDIITLLNS